jgi:hypothetical protein
MWLKGNACSCSHPTRKPTSHVMTTKVLWTISWVFVRSLPWVQHKRWIPIGSMGCVHTHWGRLAIEGCSSLSYIWSIMEKIGEDNWKVGNISRAISQVPTPRSKHDKIQAQWASSIPLENTLKKVWWCKCSKMESWRWTICCSMSCSKEGRCVCVRGGRKSQLHWGVVGNGSVIIDLC